MQRIGFPYFLVFLFLFLMITGMGTLEAFITPSSMLGYALMGPVFYFIEFYFMVAMFHLMGYMIYQYHEELGIEIDSDNERASVRAASPDAPLIAEAKEMVQDGNAQSGLVGLNSTFRATVPQVKVLGGSPGTFAAAAGPTKNITALSPAARKVRPQQSGRSPLGACARCTR